MLLMAGVFLAAGVKAQDHGGAILKLPTGPSGTARAHVGDPIKTIMRVINLDDFNDSLTITSIVDVVHHADQLVRARGRLDRELWLNWRLGRVRFQRHVGSAARDDDAGGGPTSHPSAPRHSDAPSVEWNVCCGIAENVRAAGEGVKYTD